MGWWIGGPVVGIACLTVVVHQLGPVIDAKIPENSDKRVRSADFLDSERSAR